MSTAQTSLKHMPDNKNGCNITCVSIHWLLVSVGTFSHRPVHPYILLSVLLAEVLQFVYMGHSPKNCTNEGAAFQMK